MYTCNVCGISKKDAEFYKVNNTILGHDKTCKECRKEKVRKYREENIEKKILRRLKRMIEIDQIMKNVLLNVGKDIKPRG